MSWEIIKHIGVIGIGSGGMTLELNIVSWNGRAPRYDIRQWNEDHTRMARGLTLSEDNMRKLLELFGEGGWMNEVLSQEAKDE